jgi:hypothetical protein
MYHLTYVADLSLSRTVVELHLIERVLNVAAHTRAGLFKLPDPLYDGLNALGPLEHTRENGSKLGARSRTSSHA